MRFFGLTVLALPAVAAIPCPMSWPGGTAGPYMHEGTKAWSLNFHPGALASSSREQSCRVTVGGKEVM